MDTVRIATRKSPLAIWQAEEVSRRLRLLHPNLNVELVRMSTHGDRVLDSPLAKIGGKGLFVKELEHGLLDQRADIAVHSMKDVPITLPTGLHLPVILAREDPRDAFVSNYFKSLSELPAQARVGTSSLRRQCQLKAIYPDFVIRDLRGNVNTRLAKLDANEYDAIILAAAGLKRLGFEQRITRYLSTTESLPAIGQGAIGIECRSNDKRIEALIAGLDDTDTHTRVRAERAINTRLEGGCQVPLAGFAEIDKGKLQVRALIGEPDGSKIIHAEQQGELGNPDTLGAQIADRLLRGGAGEILRKLGAEIVTPAG